MDAHKIKNKRNSYLRILSRYTSKETCHASKTIRKKNDIFLKENGKRTYS